MNIKAAFRLFDRRQDEKPASFSYARSENDVGIVLSDDFAAAAMLREKDIRMVRISGQSFESTPLLQKIERVEFFYNLSGILRMAILGGHLALGNDYTHDEKVAFEAVLHDHSMIQKKMDSLNIKALDKAPNAHGALQGMTNMNERASVWHTDSDCVLSACLDGTGTEYMEGAQTREDRRIITLQEPLPDRIRCRTTGPGDIIVMHGRDRYEGKGRNLRRFEDDGRAQLHRAGNLQGRRTVLLYSIGLE